MWHYVDWIRWAEGRNHSELIGNTRGWEINPTIIQGPSTSVQILGVGIQNIPSKVKDLCTCHSHHQERSTPFNGPFWILKAAHLLGFVTLPHIQSDLERTFGGSRKGAQLLVYPWPKTGPTLFRELISLTEHAALGGMQWSREEEEIHLTSQVSGINPGNQQSDRCYNHIVLKSQSDFESCWLCVGPGTKGFNRSRLLCKLLHHLDHMIQWTQWFLRCSWQIGMLLGAMVSPL